MAPSVLPLPPPPGVPSWLLGETPSDEAEDDPTMLVRVEGGE